MKKICDLIECSFDFCVSGIVDDSRNVKENYLFVATKGYNVDHFDYIDMAIENGAVCVIADREYKADVPVIVVDENINELYIKLCSKFYDVKPSDFNLIGITGTDGKTTTSTIVYQLLNNIKKIACIGTNGVLINDEYFPTNNTTPCIPELYNYLGIIKENDCNNIVMEVSSEALLHDRLHTFKYSVVGFTNITEDHLNVHKTLENYMMCKFKLLDLIDDNGIVIVNGDDENCKKIQKGKVYKIGINLDNDFVISDIKEYNKEVKFLISYNGKDYNIVSPLLGKYNVYNVTMAFAICLLSGVSDDYLVEGIAKLNAISGRREYLDFGQNFDIVLDYAHTYNGIKSILESVSNYKKIITVTGAAGGREKEKRPKIGSLVLDKSDIVIFTMDDPRYENVDDIIDQMVGDTKKEYFRVIDREEAIAKAFELADSDSIVLVLGKGRDNYMAIEDRKEIYSDYDVIKNYFEKR